jgi:hypothetical protein
MAIALKPRVSATAMYELADTLGLALEIDKSGQIEGSRRIKITLGKEKLELPVEVVSSHVIGAVAMVLLKVLGNLCVFTTVDDRGGGKIICVHVVDLAKMDQIAGWLEKRKPATIEIAKQLLGSAIVASFRRVKLKQVA